MEAWADEEEDFLPDSAFPEPEEDKKVSRDTRTFHQKQRDGDLDDDQDDDDGDNDEDEQLLSRQWPLKIPRGL